MTFEELIASLQQATVPSGLNPLVAALWHEAHGNWGTAHRLTQGIDSVQSAWVHAYLHRKEGDIANASYWYARANRPVSQLPLAQEWENIARAVLSQ